MISSWWNVHDLEGLKQDASSSGQLGFRGQIVIHPSHVPIVNKVFRPTMEEIAYCQELIEAAEESEKNGIAAILYKGEIVDTAMLKTAKDT
jgi:citrate lyase subunit beta/citryl-CoA lyase